MKKILMILAVLALPLTSFAADEKFQSCGEGYIIVAAGKIDGIDKYECQKLWCRDLETGKAMGQGDRANAGYKTTNGPVEIMDAAGHSIYCYGERKWCNGESAGVWNPEYGAYTKGGADNASFRSSQRGDCFAWQTQKPKCENPDEVAIMENGQWVCGTFQGAPGATRKSSIRRTGGIRVR